jgi:alkylation response protein AidB-like acyl-CoA dehydrogenase
MIKEKIGEMATQLFAGESMMYRTADMIERLIKHENPSADNIGRVTAAALEEYLIECSIMKIYGSEIQAFVVDESVQIFGGYGYIYENPAEMAYRNARINRIWEGTNEINRLTITNTLLKRIAQGRLKLQTDLDLLSQTLAQPTPITEDDPDSLDGQAEMLATARNITLYIIGIVQQRHGNDLRSEQELSGIISDMIIAIYAFESAFLRAAKMQSQKRVRTKDTALKIVKVLSVRLNERIGSLAGRALPAIADSKRLHESLSLVKSRLCPPPIDTIALIRQIADQCVKKKGYPFKVK